MSVQVFERADELSEGTHVLTVTVHVNSVDELPVAPSTCTVNAEWRTSLVRTRTWVLLGVLAAVAVVGGVLWARDNASPPGEGGVTGRFWLKDDTGRPDSPASDGRLLVVPGVTVKGLWPDDLDASNSTGPWYTTLVARLDLDQLEEQYGATVVEVASDGRFRVVAPPGPTVICDIGMGGISGCSDVDLPEHGTLRADAGEFGFRIDVE